MRAGAATSPNVRAEPDGCAVPTGPLAREIKRFLELWRTERPSTGGRFASAERGSDVAYVRGIAYLAAESGVPDWQIRAISAERYRTTELRVADPLADVLGCTHLFYDGDPPTLPIMPNPIASKRAQRACCGSPTDLLDDALGEIAALLEAPVAA